MTGDFNLVVNNALDNKNQLRIHTNKNSSEYLNNAMEEYDLIDIWRHLNPDVKQYTFHRGSMIASRLDYFIISQSLESMVKQVDIMPSLISDHSPLLLKIQICQEQRGPGFWKMNTKWLNNKDYKEQVIDRIKQVVDKNKREKLDPQMNWEMIKNEIVSHNIQYSVLKAKENKADLKMLEEAISSIENKIDLLSGNDPTLPEIIKEYIELKSKYDLNLTEKTNKTILNTKAKWFNEGQNSTKYFLNMQKRRYHNAGMAQIYLDDGSISTERQKILKEQKRFYEELYKEDPTVSFSLVNPNLNNCLDQNQSIETDAPLEMSELWYALKNLNDGKTPGTDGIPPEFYKIFWDELSVHLLHAFKYALEVKKLHSSARRGILNLIPKKDRGLLYVANWRPITLLNTDYKILAKALANRIQKNINKLISPEQTGFMKGRNISSNIRKLIFRNIVVKRKLIQFCSQWIFINASMLFQYKAC